MSGAANDLSKHVLRPSPDEIRDTRVLFHTRHATELTEARIRKYGYTVTYHKAVFDTLQGLGLQVTPGSDTELYFGDLPFDYIWFTQVEGAFLGHETMVPSIAAFRNVAFLGPPAPMRALSEDKVLGKAMAASLGIPVAKHRVIDPLNLGPDDRYLPGQWILKPRTGVMSMDIAFVGSEMGWRAALQAAADARHRGRDFLAEEFVPGLNLSVPVIEGFPLDGFPVYVERGEARNNLLTFAGKEGQEGGYRSEPYDGPGAAQASAAAARLAAAISPFDYARFDFRFEPITNRLVFLEVNMNCAMGPLAVVAQAAKKRGLTYADLVSHIFTYSLRRQQKTR